MAQTGTEDLWRAVTSGFEDISRGKSERRQYGLQQQGLDIQRGTAESTSSYYMRMAADAEKRTENAAAELKRKALLEPTSEEAKAKWDADIAKTEAMTKQIKAQTALIRSQMTEESPLNNAINEVLGMKSLLMGAVINEETGEMLDAQQWKQALIFKYQIPPDWFPDDDRLNELYSSANGISDYAMDFARRFVQSTHPEIENFDEVLDEMQKAGGLSFFPEPGKTYSADDRPEVDTDKNFGDRILEFGKLVNAASPPPLRERPEGIDFDKLISGEQQKAQRQATIPANIQSAGQTIQEGLQAGGEAIRGGAENIAGGISGLGQQLGQGLNKAFTPQEAEAGGGTTVTVNFKPYTVDPIKRVVTDKNGVVVTGKIAQKALEKYDKAQSQSIDVIQGR